MSEALNPAPEPAAPTIDASTASDTEFQAALEQIEGAPEGDPAADPATDQQQPAAQKMVPLSALHEARAETRKEREERIRNEAVFNDRLTKIQQALAVRERPPELAIPEFDADPALHLKHRLDQQDQIIQQTQQERQRAHLEQQFHTVYQRAAQQFSAEAVDFPQAYQHAVGHMTALERATGISAVAMEQEIAATALRQGRNPAQAIYEFAKVVGYAQRAAEPPLAAQQRGQAATRSVGQGGSPGGTVNTAAQELARADLKTIGAMSDADFEKVLATIR